MVNFGLRQKCTRISANSFGSVAVIEDDEVVKFLGIHPDHWLTWGYSLTFVCSKVVSGIYAVWKLAKLCSLGIIKWPTTARTNIRCTVKASGVAVLNTNLKKFIVRNITIRAI